MRIAICNWMENIHLAGNCCLLCVYFCDFYIHILYVMYDLYISISYHIVHILSYVCCAVNIYIYICI